MEADRITSATATGTGQLFIERVTEIAVQSHFSVVEMIFNGHRGGVSYICLNAEDAEALAKSLMAGAERVRMSAEGK